MSKKAVTPVPRQAVAPLKLNPSLKAVLWRLDRLERQVRTLSELVRDHAEDADRLVRIVAEDHEVLRQELLREHQEWRRKRKRDRVGGRKVGLVE
ncbi:hypothetical protein [Nitrospira sp. Kam-Ns4a]